MKTSVADIPVFQPSFTISDAKLTDIVFGFVVPVAPQSISIFG